MARGLSAGLGVISQAFAPLHRLPAPPLRYPASMARTDTVTTGARGARRRDRAAPAQPPARARPGLPEWVWPAAAVLVAAVVRAIAWRQQPFITVDGTQFVRFAEA